LLKHGFEQLVLSIALKGDHVKYCVQGVQHDRPSLQRLRLIVSETVWLLDQSSTILCTTLYNDTVFCDVNGFLKFQI